MIHAAAVIQSALRLGVYLLPANLEENPIPVQEAYVQVQAGADNVRVQLRQHLPQIPFVGPTGYIQPNVIRTFVHREMTVCAPALYGQQIGVAFLQVWANTHGKLNVFAPLPIAPPVSRAAEVDNPVALSRYRDQAGQQTAKASGRQSRSRERSSSRSKPKSGKQKQGTSRSRTRSNSNSSAKRSSSRGSTQGRSRSNSRPRSRSKSAGNRSKSRGRSTSRPRSQSRSPKRSNSRGSRKESKSPNNPQKKRQRSNTPARKQRVKFAKKGGSPKNRNNDSN